MTHLFQPLGLTVNGHCKVFLKRKFAQWFGQQFDKQLSLGKRVEDIEMKFHLTEIKPIHAKWITQCYDYMRRWVQGNHKRLEEIEYLRCSYEQIFLLPSLDPFQIIGQLPQLDGEPSETIYPSDVLQDFINTREDDDDSDWGDNDVDFERNAFYFIIDDE